MDDLKYLKKHYGEGFMKYCRENFATILQNEGVLTQLITSNYAQTHSLSEDIFGYEIEFRDFIFDQFDKVKGVQEDNSEKIVGKTPSQLLSEKGYILHPECASEADIQAFRHYYKRDDGRTVSYNPTGYITPHDGEEICTFSGGRLNLCRVFFAVKDNIDEIRRIDYPLPGEDFSSVGGKSFDDVKDEYAKKFGKDKTWEELTSSQKQVALRDNAYGTSIISIQMSKLGRETVSIKNRYNHHLPSEINPDSTYGNNLNNIADGLVASFNFYFNMNIEKGSVTSCELPKYVYCIGDGKRYRYNQEINGIYYCENNTIINHGRVETFDPSRYIVLDNGVIIDKKEKTAFPFDKTHDDSFYETLQQVSKIDVVVDKKSGERVVIFSKEGQENVILTLDKHGALIGIEDPNLVETPPYYCKNSQNLRKINFANLTKFNYGSFSQCNELQEIVAPNLESIEDYCFYMAASLQKIDFSNLKSLGSGCFFNVNSLESFNAPNLQRIKNYSFNQAPRLKTAIFPHLKVMGDGCFSIVDRLEVAKFDILKGLPNACFQAANSLQVAFFPNLEYIDDNCFSSVNCLKKADFPSLIDMRNSCFANANNLKSANFQNLEEIGCGCFMVVPSLESFNASNLEVIDSNCFINASKLKHLELENLRRMGDRNFYNVDNLESVRMINLQETGDDCFHYAKNLSAVELPILSEVGDECFWKIQSFQVCKEISEMGLGSQYSLGNRLKRCIKDFGRKFAFDKTNECEEDSNQCLLNDFEVPDDLQIVYPTNMFEIDNARNQNCEFERNNTNRTADNNRIEQENQGENAPKGQSEK